MTFPRNYWEPDTHGVIYIMEFLETDWKTRTALGPPPSDQWTLDFEIPRLVALKPQRAALKADVEFHATNSFFSTLFPRRLMFNRYSHPATFEVLRVGITLPNSVAVYYKNLFQRDRPSRLSAAVDPMIEVPGHAAYPSGHATQAYLAAHLLQLVHPDGGLSEWQQEIFGMAHHVAWCREVAGVHYESDSVAGTRLAKSSFDILTDASLCPQFADLLRVARNEWRDRTSSSPRPAAAQPRLDWAGTPAS
jgi:membrane-associated phospholipid phosphatase